ncbi:MAG TPA: CorA family divalent cation transporter [Caulobacteraceae bacterium]|jgi:zinc transporter|nr:CorA family divalent cation transporter [Caulobacteraceae bacterium]
MVVHEQTARRAAPDDAMEAPPDGVICAFAFEGGVGAPAEAANLAAAASGAGWTWLHVRLSDARALAIVRRVPGLPPRALQLFLTQEERIQLEQADGWVFGVLPDYERDLGGAPQKEGRLCFAFDDTHLVTGRLHALLAVDDLRLAVVAGEQVSSPAAALTRLFELFASRTEAVLEELGDQLAQVEDYVLAGPAAPREAHLTSLRRQIWRRRRETQTLRRVFARVVPGRHGRGVEAFDDSIAAALAWLEDVDHEAADLQERGRLLHEEIDTLLNAATNRSMRTLTVISTLLIPPTLIVGAFGMNVPGIPWEHSATGFWTASALCAAVVVGALWLLRRLGMFS